MHIKFSWLLSIAICCFMLYAPAGVYGDSQHAPANKICPVMEGNAVSEDIFTTHKGKKVYFCCKVCKGKFLNNPDKYLSKLPQFTSLPGEEGHEHESARTSEGAHNNGFSPVRLIEPLGVVTLVLLIATALSGFFMKKNRKLLFKWHKRIAIAVIIAALFHAALVIISH